MTRTEGILADNGYDADLIQHDMEKAVPSR